MRDCPLIYLCGRYLLERARRRKTCGGKHDKTSPFEVLLSFYIQRLGKPRRVNESQIPCSHKPQCFHGCRAGEEDLDAPGGLLNSGPEVIVVLFAENVAAGGK